MKTSRRIITLALILIAGFATTSAQSRKEKKEAREKAVKEQVLSEDYKINVSTAYPRGGKTIHLSSPYSLEIRNDSVISYLPFYGRAYSIPYGGGNGLIFKTRLDSYEMKTDKKGPMKIEFAAKTTEDKFTFNLHIYPNGSTNIHVNMQNRESISFMGEVE